jgi:hypothetical protein
MHDIIFGYLLFSAMCDSRTIAIQVSHTIKALSSFAFVNY